MRDSRINSATALAGLIDHGLLAGLDDDDHLYILYDAFAGDIYTLDTASIVLTAGTLTANSLTDGTATLSSGNLTGMGNITGDDVDLTLGTGDILTSGTLGAGVATLGALTINSTDSSDQIQIYHDNAHAWYRSVSYTHLTLPTTPYV